MRERGLKVPSVKKYQLKMKMMKIGYQPLRKKMRTNNLKIRNLKNKIAVVRKELGDRRKSQKVEQSPSGHEAVGDVEGEGNERGAHAGEQHEQPADKEPPSATVVEEGVAPDHPPDVIDVGDDDAKGDVPLEPLNVMPLCSFVGDPRTV